MPTMKALASTLNVHGMSFMRVVTAGKYVDYGTFDPFSIMLYGPGAYHLVMGQGDLPFTKNMKLSQGDIDAIKYLFPAPADLPLTQLDQTYHSLPGSKPFATVSVENKVMGHKFANTLNSQLISLDRIARSSGLRIFVLAGNDQRLDKLSQVVLQVVKALATNNGFRLRVTAMKHSTDEVRIYSV